MSDDYSISYSYQSGDPAPDSRINQPASADIDNTLYAVADIERVDLRNGGVLLIDRNSDAQMISAQEVSIALNSCRTFRTLEGHAEFLAATIPQLAGQQADVLNVLKSVRDNGLLTTAESVCQRLCPAGTPTATDLPPTRVFVITCDRPPAVKRLLESMLQVGNLSRHEHLFLVDDSRDPQNADQNRDAVETFNLTSPRDMHYIGAAEQQRLMNTLISELPACEQDIRFLIDRQQWTGQKTYGLARNICLLFSVGRRAIVMDDDVICAAVASPLQHEGLAFDDAEREVEFYSSEQDILNRARRMDFDPLTGHASCLGLTMAQAINRLGIDALQASDLEGAKAAYLDLWDADSPVLMTQSGTLGDPGTVGTQWIYSLSGASAQRALQAPGGLEGALSNRHYWLGQPRPMFSKMAVISQVTGLDNSRLLPPYFPVFRGEDYLFGAMTELLHPRATTLDYPWSVPHFPLEQRSGNPAPPPVTGRGNINLGKYVTDRTLYRTGISVETRLVGLSQLVRELAETSDSGLLALFRTEVAENQGAQAQRLAARLQDGSPRPATWQAWLQQSIGNLNASMQSVTRPQDLPRVPDNLGDQAILDEFRGHATGFAGSLAKWPAIRSAAHSTTENLLSGRDLLP
jgi:hypothetical protein